MFKRHLKGAISRQLFFKPQKTSKTSFPPVKKGKKKKKLGFLSKRIKREERCPPPWGGGPLYRQSEKGGKKDWPKQVTTRKTPRSPSHWSGKGRPHRRPQEEKGRVRVRKGEVK